MAGSARSRSEPGTSGPTPARAGPTLPGIRPTTVPGRIAPALLCVILGACLPFSGPDAEVRLDVSSAHFEAGEEIGFEVRNGFGRDIAVDVCPDGNLNVELLQRVRGRWQSRGGHCPIVTPRTLAPGERLTGSRPGDTVEGLYALSLTYFYTVSDGDVFGLAVPALTHSKGFQITD